MRPAPRVVPVQIVHRVIPAQDRFQIERIEWDARQSHSARVTVISSGPRNIDVALLRLGSWSTSVSGPAWHGEIPASVLMQECETTGTSCMKLRVAMMYSDGNRTVTHKPTVIDCF
jgi:hypothetical protein